MNIQNFKKVLPTLLKNDIVAFLWGNQGIGKTQTVKQVADEAGIGFVHLHLATQEVGDLVGLLVNNGDGTVAHARPEWFPTEGEGIVFLDELNRAHPDVIQAMFSFITSKTIHRHTLPKGWKIVAAGNGGEGFNVTDTSDNAWHSRFCHIELQPTVEEFCAFVESKGNDSVADFIRDHSSMLCVKPKESAIPTPPSPDPRSWNDCIARLEREDMEDGQRFEVYSGLVGEVPTTTFFAWKKKADKAIKLKDIMKDYGKVRNRVRDAHKEKDTRFDLLSGPIDELTHKLGERTTQDFLTEESVENLKLYFLDLPLELLQKALVKLGGMQFGYKSQLIDDPVFCGKLSKRAG